MEKGFAFRSTQRIEEHHLLFNNSSASTSGCIVNLQLNYYRLNKPFIDLSSIIKTRMKTILPIQLLTITIQGF